MNTLMIFITACLGLLCLAGAIMLWKGLRGRRINDHPICRKCGFDLVGVYAPAPEQTEQPGGTEQTGGTGVPPVADSEAHLQRSSESVAAGERCPECGRRLDGKRAVRFGDRRRRPGLIASGTVCLVLALSIAGAMGWGAASGFNWNSIKPAPLLVWETRSPDDAVVEAALRELAGRAADGRLPRAAHETLVERALELQTDDGAAWVHAWGDLVEIAHAQGWLSSERFLSYVKRAPNISISVRSPVSHGDSTSLHITFNPARAGSGAHRSYSMIIELVELRLDGESLHPPDAHVKYAPGPGTAGWRLPNIIPAAQPGERRVEAIFRMRSQPKNTSQPGGTSIGVYAHTYTPDDADSEPWTSAKTTVYTVLEPGESDLVMTAAPELADAIRDSIRIDNPVVTRGDDGDDISLTVMINQPPVNVAFDVYLRTDHGEVRLGSCVGMPSTSMGMGLSAPGVSLDAAGAALVFRASPDAARQLTRMREIWEGEVVIENVNWAVRQGTTQTPTTTDDDPQG